MLDIKPLALAAAVAWTVVPAAAPAQPSNGADSSQGVTVPVKLDQHISSATAKEGDRFTFTTTREVQVGGVDVPAGSSGHGVVASVRAARWDKGGDLALQVQSLDLPDGRTITVAAMHRTLGSGTPSMVQTALKDAKDDLHPDKIATALVPLTLPVHGIIMLGSALKILKGHNVEFGAGTPFSVVALPSTTDAIPANQ